MNDDEGEIAHEDGGYLADLQRAESCARESSNDFGARNSQHGPDEVQDPNQRQAMWKTCVVGAVRERRLAHGFVAIRPATSGAGTRGLTRGPACSRE